MAKKASRYERESKRALKELLLIASSNAELRKRAGYPANTMEPAFGLDVSFISQAEMKSLNRKFRGKDYPTDVLSFPALEIFARQGHLGDLVICEAVLERQAKELGHSPLQELYVLLIHGLLHLLGFDHEKSSREAAEMAKWEARLLGMISQSLPPKAGLIARNGGKSVRKSMGASARRGKSVVKKAAASRAGAKKATLKKAAAKTLKKTAPKKLVLKNKKPAIKRLAVKKASSPRAVARSSSRN